MIDLADVDDLDASRKPRCVQLEQPEEGGELLRGPCIAFCQPNRFFFVVLPQERLQALYLLPTLDIHQLNSFCTVALIAL